MAEVFHRSQWGQQIHECDQLKEDLAKGGVYPLLVTEIYFDPQTKTPAASNGADVSHINFCPFCGTDLKEVE